MSIILIDEEWTRKPNTVTKLNFSHPTAKKIASYYPLIGGNTIDIGPKNTKAVATQGISRAVNADGVSTLFSDPGHINFGDIHDLETNGRKYTIGCRFSTTDSEFTLIAKSKYASEEGRFAIVKESASNLYLFLQTSGGVAFAYAGAGYNDGKTHSVVGVIDYPDTVSIYIDGVLKQTTAISGTITTTNNYLFLLGAYNNSSGTGIEATNLRYSGLMSDVFVSYAAWSARDVKAYHRFEIFEPRTILIPFTASSGVSVSATLNSYIQELNKTATSTLSAYVQQQGLLTTATLSAIIQQTNSNTAALSAYVQTLGNVKIATLNAIIQTAGGGSVSATLNALVQEYGLTQSATLNALIQAMGNTRTATLNAIIYAVAPTIVATMNAHIFQADKTVASTLNAIVAAASGVWLNESGVTTAWATEGAAVSSWTFEDSL